MTDDRMYLMPAEDFEQSNITIGPPKGMSEDECQSLRARVDETGITSCWEVTDEQLEAIRKNRKIYMHVYGMGHPMVCMCAVDPIEDFRPLRKKEK